METHVEMFRPEHRFGCAVIVWRRGMDDRRHVLHFHEDGRETWDPVDPNVDMSPPQWTYYFDDEVLREIATLWTEKQPPPQPPDPRLPDVLTSAVMDARRNRDDMVALLREIHQLAVRPPTVLFPGTELQGGPE